MELTDVIPILQVAVGPVILISGIGLLLLSITNRYGRVIDRSRFLGDGLRKSGELGGHVSRQLDILLRRARLLRTSIICGVTAVLCTAVLIIGIFAGSLVRFPVASFVVAMFSACMLSLVGSLVCLLRDVNLSLAALDLDVEDARKSASRP